ncbi:MAG: M23 family metallopeptidase [Chloroflexi bacterium]|nr:M23 family metallopeptidase [Chloroflexota bacterium]
MAIKKEPRGIKEHEEIFKILRALCVFAVCFLAAACVAASPAESVTPSPRPTLDQVGDVSPPPSTNRPQPTFTATRKPTPLKTPYPTKIPNATFTPVKSFAATLIAPPQIRLGLGRPIDWSDSNVVDPYYRYGTTQNGKLHPHHGVEFYNPAGVPLYSVGEGWIVFAGPDTGVLGGVGSYGNAVVIELTQTFNGQPIFAVYGHMDTITVKLNQFVPIAFPLGTVGSTGMADGPHLHFEIRVGYNDYESTRNPELWLKPFPSWGVLAGRVLDKDGNFIYEASIIARPIETAIKNPSTFYSSTYANETVNPDPFYGENFVIGDLVAGKWEVLIKIGLEYRSQIVTIKPQQITWVEVRE